MASTYTAKLRLTMPATGDLNGLWGGTVNSEITSLIEQAIAGRAAIVMTDADYTPTALNGASDEARNMVLRFTGTLTAGRNIVVPAQAKLYIVENAITGGFALTVKTAAGTGVAVPAGSSMLLRCDGTNVVGAYTAFTGNVTGNLTGNVTGNLTGNVTGSGTSSFAKAYTPTVSPAFSATPTFDAATTNVFEFGALTGNVSAMTISNGSPGQTINIRFVQDGTGGRTVALPTAPAAASVAGSVNGTASKVSWLILTLSTAGNRWEGSWSQLP